MTKGDFFAIAGVVVVSAGLLGLFIYSEGRSIDFREEARTRRLEAFKAGIKTIEEMDGDTYYYLNDGGLWRHSDWSGWSQIAPATERPTP